METVSEVINMAKKKPSPKKKTETKKTCNKKCSKKKDVGENLPESKSMEFEIKPQSKTAYFLNLMKKAFGYE